MSDSDKLVVAGFVYACGVGAEVSLGLYGVAVFTTVFAVLSYLAKIVEKLEDE